MNDKTALELLKYIADNLQTESIFLTPHPESSIEFIGLMDKIAELRGISKESNGIQFNEIMDRKEI